MLTEAPRRRRVEAAESDRFVERLFGLELAQSTYDRGAAFVEGVLERAGEAGLRRLLADAENLTTPPGVDAPGPWRARLVPATRSSRTDPRLPATAAGCGGGSKGRESCLASPPAGAA